MRRAILAISVLFAVAACREQPKAGAKPAAPPREEEVVLDRDNLLDLTRGSVVIHRTGEGRLASSAMHAIDGSDATAWSTPPDDLQQSVTIELTAPSRVKRIGFSTGKLVDAARAAKEISFESSMDGINFEKLASPSFARTGDRQTVDVPQRETRFIRATLVSNYGDPQVTDVLSLVAHGDQDVLRGSTPLTGEWMLNRTRARLAEQGWILRGEIEMNPIMSIFGTRYENIIPFVWVRGDKQFGVGVISANRSAERLNSMWYFEEAFPIFAGEPWFGEKLSTQATIRNENVVEEFFRRAGRVPLYDFRRSIDQIERIVKENSEQRLRFVAHEFRRKTAAENRKVAESEIAALKNALQARGIDLARLEFVAAGSDRWQKPSSTIEMMLFSRIMLESPK